MTDRADSHIEPLHGLKGLGARSIRIETHATSARYGAEPCGPSLGGLLDTAMTKASALTTEHLRSAARQNFPGPNRFMTEGTRT